MVVLLPLLMCLRNMPNGPKSVSFEGFSVYYGDFACGKRLRYLVIEREVLDWAE